MEFIDWLIKNYPDKKEWVNIIEINCDESNITSLEGIENLLNLKKLECRHNNIVSLNPLKMLINLESLYCGANNLTSLKGIEKLYKLKDLSIWENKIFIYKKILKLNNLEYFSTSTICLYKNDILKLRKELLITHRKDFINKLSS